METYQQLIHTLALAMGTSWTSGINLYATLAVLGFCGAIGDIQLPANLMILTNPLVIGASSLMYFVEFITDKIPGVDTAWDGIHTFIRIPAGVLLAAGAVGDVSPALQIAAGILGGAMATATHVTKAGSRVIINTSPEPFTNWVTSVAEDLLVFGSLWTALHYPWIFLGFLVLSIGFMIWLLPKIVRGIARAFKFIGKLFQRQETTAGTPPPAP